MASLRALDNYEAKSLLATIACSTAYKNTSEFYVGGANQVELHCRFTKGSSIGCLLIVESSKEKTAWHQESRVSVAGSLSFIRPVTYKLGTSGNTNIKMVLANGTLWKRIRYRADTTNTGAKLAIDYTLANV